MFPLEIIEKIMLFTNEFELIHHFCTWRTYKRSCHNNISTSVRFNGIYHIAIFYSIIPNGNKKPSACVRPIAYIQNETNLYKLTTYVKKFNCENKTLFQYFDKLALIILIHGKYYMFWGQYLKNIKPVYHLRTFHTNYGIGSINRQFRNKGSHTATRYIYGEYDDVRIKRVIESFKKINNVHVIPC